MAFEGMVDLARSPKEIKDERSEAKASMAPASEPSVPIYPYGMCLSMDEEVLKKLGLDGDLPDVGEMIHIAGMAKVTSVSEREEVQPDGSKKACCRVELQITHLAAEDEDRESTLEEREARDKERSTAFYDESESKE